MFCICRYCVLYLTEGYDDGYAGINSHIHNVILVE